MAFLTKRLLEIVAGAKLTHADVELFHDARDQFDNARRRLNAKRKKAGRALTGANKKYEWHARGVVAESLKGLAISACIDLAELETEERARMRTEIAGAAAMLLSHREVFAAGGVTMAHVELFEKGRGN